MGRAFLTWQALVDDARAKGARVVSLDPAGEEAYPAGPHLSPHLLSTPPFLICTLIIWLLTLIHQGCKRFPLTLVLPPIDAGAMAVA